MTKALDLSLAYKVADMALADFGISFLPKSARAMSATL